MPVAEAPPLPLPELEQAPPSPEAVATVSPDVGAAAMGQEVLPVPVDATPATEGPTEAPNDDKEVRWGRLAGNALGLAAEALSARLRTNGHETGATLLERSHRVIGWAGGIGIRRALASESGGNTNWGLVAGVAARTYGKGPEKKR